MVNVLQSYRGIMERRGRWEALQSWRSRGFGSETSGRAHRGEIQGCHCQGMQMCCFCCHSSASHCVPRDVQCCVQPCRVCGGGGDPQHSLFCSSSLEEPFCCCRFSFGCSLSNPMEWQGSTAFIPGDEGKPRAPVQGPRWEEERFQQNLKAACCLLADRWQRPESTIMLPELQLLLTPVLLLDLGEPLCVSQNLSLSSWWEQGAGCLLQVCTRLGLLLQSKFLWEIGGG